MQSKKKMHEFSEGIFFSQIYQELKENQTEPVTNK